MISINDLPVDRVPYYVCRICSVHYLIAKDMRRHCEIMHNAKVNIS